MYYIKHEIVFHRSLYIKHFIEELYGWKYEMKSSFKKFDGLSHCNIKHLETRMHFSLHVSKRILEETLMKSCKKQFLIWFPDTRENMHFFCISLWIIPNDQFEKAITRGLWSLSIISHGCFNLQLVKNTSPCRSPDFMETKCHENP